MQVSGSSANDVAKQLKDASYFIQGHRENVASLRKVCSPRFVVPGIELLETQEELVSLLHRH